MFASTLLRNLIPLFSVLCLIFIIGGVAATDEAGTKYLEEKSSEAGVVTLPSGLRYKVLEKGKGAFHPKVNSPCLCHYGGTLIDGTGERYVLIMYQCEVLLYLMESLFSKNYL